MHARQTIFSIVAVLCVAGCTSTMTTDHDSSSDAVNAGDPQNFAGAFSLKIGKPTPVTTLSQLTTWPDGSLRALVWGNYDCSSPGYGCETGADGTPYFTAITGRWAAADGGA